MVTNQEFSSPQKAFDNIHGPGSLSHYGVKGMKWGVRKKDETSSQNAGNGDELAPLIAVAAIFAGIKVIQARFAYVDSGRRDAKVINKQEKKSGIKHEFKKNDNLTGPKTVQQLQKDVVDGVNPGFPTERGTSMNCRRCTFAYEMRRRGYDVQATKSIMATGQDMSGVIKATAPKDATKATIRRDSYTYQGWGKNPIATSVNGRPMTPDGKARSIFNELGRQPNGARGELAFSWAFGGGHSVAYEVVGGKPVIFCTQTRRTWTNPEMFAAEQGTILGDAAYTRLDNQPMNNEFLKRWVVNSA